MAKKQLPSPDKLRKLLRYDPDAGKLYWRVRLPHMFRDGKQSAQKLCEMFNTQRAGYEAGCINSRGYVVIGMEGSNFYAHRIIWMMVYGEPPNFIDHINHIHADNRLSNIRSVTEQENHMNKPMSKRNKSGVTGVGWNIAEKSWTSIITVRGMVMHLGLHKNIKDAIRIRKAAEKKYGFHKNHGLNIGEKT